VTTEPGIEALLRELAPQVLGALVRRHGRFDACEDAVQEAMLAAVLQWTPATVPDNPRSWLLSVASRRLVDEWRSQSARRRREEQVVVLESASKPQPTRTTPSRCCSCAATRRSRHQRNSR
jgi:predicted RNA polymerase sigma factor